MSTSSLAKERAKAIHIYVKQVVSDYIDQQLGHRIKPRHCAFCGRSFRPRQRWHFFHTPECRKGWYRGQFKPRD